MSGDPTVVDVPQPKHVRDTLVGLLGRTVDLDTAGLYSGEATSTWASYVDDAGRLRAVAVADLAFSAHAGAAIGLVPPAGAQAAVEDGALPPMLQENLYEVLNVCASLLNAEGRPHVRLYDVHHVGDAPPRAVADHGHNPARRLDLAVEVAGYGAGRLSVICVG